MKIKILVATILAIFCFNGIYSIVQFSKAPKNSRDFSHEEIRIDFETALNQWTSNQDFLEINNISLVCDIDEMFLKRDLNQKALQNVFLYVDIFHEPVEITKEAIDYADQVYDSLGEYLYRDTTYGKLIYQIDINRYVGEDKNGGCVGFHRIVTGNNGRQNKVRQPKDELNAQTIAYSFTKELRQKKYLKDGIEIPYGSPVLTRFGIDPVSKSLVVEIEMTKPEKNHMEAFYESLDAVGEELYELFVRDKKTATYLEKNDVSAVSVQFITALESDDFYYEYHHEI